jgi:hypothetical protein
MAEFQDLEIRRPAVPVEPAPERRTGRWIAVALLIVASAAAAYIVFGRSSPAEPERVGVAVADQPVTQPVTASQDDLPPLAEMDPVVRQLVGALSSHPRLLAWLATDNLLRNIVEVVDAIAANRTPARLLPVLAPGQPFAVERRGDAATIDPRSFARYDAVVDAFASVDAERTAEVYARLRPRLEEAYRERFVGGSFHDRLREALAVLADTPTPPAAMAVVPFGAGYAFADPDLESRSPAQKHLLRTGPRNVRIVKSRLQELARWLDAPRSSS